MRLEVRFIADVHKVKAVEYLDRTTGRMAKSWRLILDYGDDTGEIKCTEDIAVNVKRHNRYEFIATVDPSVKETNFRIVGIAENLGLPGDDSDFHPDALNNTYTQQTLAGVESSPASSRQDVVLQGAVAGPLSTSDNSDGTTSEQVPDEDSSSRKKGSK